MRADHGRRWSSHLPPSQQERRAGLEARAEHARRSRSSARRRRSRSRTSPVYKNTAYLNSWSRRSTPRRRTCERGGFFSVDISDPAQPRQLAFGRRCPATTTARARTSSRSRTAATCSPSTTSSARPAHEPPEPGGGFALYDVSEPGATPRSSSTAPATTGPVGALVCCDSDAAGRRRRRRPRVPLRVHVARRRQGLPDRRRQQRAGADRRRHLRHHRTRRAPGAGREYDFDQEFPIRRRRRGRARRTTCLLHDMVVKEINGVQTLLAVLLGRRLRAARTSTIRPTRSTSATRRFDDTDPLTGKTPPEGNAPPGRVLPRQQVHPRRRRGLRRLPLLGRGRPGRPRTSSSSAAPASRPTRAPLISRDQRPRSRRRHPLRRPRLHARRRSRPPTGDATIAVVERGDCDFQVKTENAEARGYKGSIIFDPATRHANAPCDDAPQHGLHGLHRRRRRAVRSRASVGFRMIGSYDAATFTCAASRDADADADGAASTACRSTSTRGSTAGATRTCTGAAPASSTKSARRTRSRRASTSATSTDFGDLSIHEFATDPDDEPRLRVLLLRRPARRRASATRGIQEVGGYIDAGGNNFWGVEQFTAKSGERLIAASDRDFGLYIFRYTGPDAAAGVPAQPPAPRRPPPAAKDTADPLISLLSNRRQSLRTLRNGGPAVPPPRQRGGASSRWRCAGRFTSTLKRGARGKVRMLKDERGDQRRAPGRP